MAYEYDELHAHLTAQLDFHLNDAGAILVDKPAPFETNVIIQADLTNISDERSVYLSVTKRVFDLIFSVIVMLSGLPVFCLLILITKLSSRGQIFFKQQRLGKHGRPFYIYKFRSMRLDAEKFGPQLSSQSDPRITKWGRVLRRTRLDELPQFWNVIKGDMSVVGPRPERQYFVDKIIERRPDYIKLRYLRPGLTSLGQVAYGYAENVDQMCERMRFDLSYLRSVSFRTDCGVIIRTVGVMFALKGK